MKTALIFLSCVVFSLNLSALTPIMNEDFVTPESVTKHPSYADLVEKLLPAVVNISTTHKPKKRNSRIRRHHFGSPFEDLPEGHPFKRHEEFFQFFGDDPFSSPFDRQRGRDRSALGSGFVISADGYIVTNNHVIEGADEITVTFDDDTKLEAEILGRDKKTDLALIKVDSNTPLKYVDFGNSDIARVGDFVIAIGNPFGLGGSVSSGIISARSRDINSGPFDNYIQTDAAINRGNSGGPMFNLDGEVIGINTAIYSPNGVGNVGIGFAIPSNMASNIIDQLKLGGTVTRGWLGVKIQHVTEEIADSLGLEKEEGALVAEVMKDSPAEKAGIKAGDLILKFDGKAVSAMKKLPRIVAETNVGKEVTVEILRGGEPKTLKVEIAKLDEEDEVAANDNTPEKEIDAMAELGLKLEILSDEIKKARKIADDIDGLLVTGIYRGSDAEARGIKRGDVILEVNQNKTLKLDDFETALEKSREANKKAILLLIYRNKSTLFTTLPIAEAEESE